MWKIPSLGRWPSVKGANLTPRWTCWKPSVPFPIKRWLPMIKLWLFAKINTFLSSFFKYLKAIFQKNMRSFLTYPNKKYIITVTVNVKFKKFLKISSLGNGLGHFLHWTVYVIPVKKYFKNRLFLTGGAFFLRHTVLYLYPTEKWGGAWSLREMGSTRVGGMGEGPAPQAERKISSWSPAGEETTAPWSNREDGKKSQAWQRGPIVHRVHNMLWMYSN